MYMRFCFFFGFCRFYHLEFEFEEIMAEKTKFRSVRKHLLNDDSQSLPHDDQKSNAARSRKAPKTVTIATPSLSRESSSSANAVQNELHSYNHHKRNPSQSVMVRLKRLDTLRLNQRIKVKDYGYGSIAFLGCVHFAQGLFVGVELDEPRGKHDGSYHGKRYFTAKDKHGVLVKQHRVELLDVVDTAPTNENENDDDDPLALHAQQRRAHSHQKSVTHFDEFFLDNSSLQRIMRDDDEPDVHAQTKQYTQYKQEVSELQLRNETLNEKIEQYIKTVDDLEVKISHLETENMSLKQEKLQYENEMNAKIEELEEQLQNIRVRLDTKDEVLRKQIANHENIKEKFRKKIKDYDALQQKNQDIVQLIFYGENTKDDLIAELKKKEKMFQMQQQENAVEIESLNTEHQQRLNSRIEQWLFEYGDVC